MAAEATDARARPDLRNTLASRATRGFGDRGGRRARELLIAAELALTVALLVSAALLGRSFLRLTGIGIGFATEDVLTFELSFPESHYPDREAVLQGQDALLERLAGLPGAERVALTSDLPFTSWNMFERVDVPGHPQRSDELPLVEFHRVSEEYFSALAIPLLRGRGPLPAERAGGREEVVINRSMAALFWPDRDPLGAHFRFESGDSTLTVVVAGLVEDVLDDGFDATHEPRFYRSHRATPNRWMTVTLAASGDVSRLAEPARRVVADFDPLIPVWNVRTLEQLVRSSVAGQRILLILVAAFALLTLLLGAVGIYGVVAYAVGERTGEIGLRSALGATRKDVVALVLRSSLVMAGIGLLAGGVLALAAGQLVSGLLFGVSPFDPISLLGVGLVLGATAVVAVAAPARRAANVDPAEALRSQ